MAPETPPTTRRTRHHRTVETSSEGSPNSSSSVVETPTPAEPPARTLEPAASIQPAPTDLSTILQHLQTLTNQVHAMQKSAPAEQPPRDPSPAVPNPPAATPPTDIRKMALELVQADVNDLLPDRCRVTLTLDNYSIWSGAIESDADLLNASTVLVQDNPPPDDDPLDQEIWHRKAVIICACMLSATNSLARNKLGDTKGLNAHQLWDLVANRFGRSTGEERMLLIKELHELHIKDNDYLTYQNSFNHIFDRLKALGQYTADNFEHDLFFLGLGNWNKAFIKSKLDEVYATHRGPVQNLDLTAIQTQLTSRAGTQNRDKPPENRNQGR